MVNIWEKLKRFLIFIVKPFFAEVKDFLVLFRFFSSYVCSALLPFAASASMDWGHCVGANQDSLSSSSHSKSHKSTSRLVTDLALRNILQRTRIGYELLEVESVASDQIDLVQNTLMVPSCPKRHQQSDLNCHVLKMQSKSLAFAIGSHFGSSPFRPLAIPGKSGGLLVLHVAGAEGSRSSEDGSLGQWLLQIWVLAKL